MFDGHWLFISKLRRRNCAMDLRKQTGKCIIVGFLIHVLICHLPHFQRYIINSFTLFLNSKPTPTFWFLLFSFCIFFITILQVLILLILNTFQFIWLPFPIYSQQTGIYFLISGHFMRKESF